MLFCSMALDVLFQLTFINISVSRFIILTLCWSSDISCSLFAVNYAHPESLVQGSFSVAMQINSSLSDSKVGSGKTGRNTWGILSDKLCLESRWGDYCEDDYFAVKWHSAPPGAVLHSSGPLAPMAFPFGPIEVIWVAWRCAVKSI